MLEYSTGNQTVDAMASIQLTGNIIPQIWYKQIVRDNGKPHLLAISILADITYWYRPTEIRDPGSGQFMGFKKKFAGDLLQRSYQQIPHISSSLKAFDRAPFNITVHARLSNTFILLVD